MEIDLNERKPIEAAHSVNGAEVRHSVNGVPTSALADSAASHSSLPPSDGKLVEVGAPSIEKPVEFNSLLNEITLPMLKAEDEKREANRSQHFQGEVGKWEPKELKPRHREMMRRILEGATYIEIAEEMGLSTQTIMLVCSSAIFKEELTKLDNELNLNVIRRAEDLSNEALDKLKRLMRSARSEGLQAKCAESVLGIAGYSKIEKKQVSVISGEDVIRELNRQRREASQQPSYRNLRKTVGGSDNQLEPTEADISI